LRRAPPQLRQSSDRNRSVFVAFRIAGPSRQLGFLILSTTRMSTDATAISPSERSLDMLPLPLALVCQGKRMDADAAPGSCIAFPFSDARATFSPSPARQPRRGGRRGGNFGLVRHKSLKSLLSQTNNVWKSKGPSGVGAHSPCFARPSTCYGPVMGPVPRAPPILPNILLFKWIFLRNRSGDRPSRLFFSVS